MALSPDLYNNLLAKIYEMYPETMHKKDILPNVSVVLGGAGTGKTKVLTSRIKFLIDAGTKRDKTLAVQSLNNLYLL